MTNQIFTPQHRNNQTPASVAVEHGVSLVLVVDPALERGVEIDRIMAAIEINRQNFQRLGWKSEMIVVSRDAERSELPEGVTVLQLSEDAASTVNCMTEMAMKTATLDWVALVDPGAAPEEIQWRWLAAKMQQHEMACSYRRESGRELVRKRRWLTRVLVFCYSLMVRILLKTGNHAHRAGVLLVSKESIQNTDFQSKHGAVKTNLTAMMKIARCKVAEIAVEDRTSVQNSLSDDEQLSLIAETLGILRSSGQTVRFWWNSIAFPRQQVELSALSAGTVKSGWLKRDLLGWASLVAIAVFVLSCNLNYPLFEPDEARNAQIGLEIYETGQWMTLKLNGENYWDKPPLVGWATAASYHMFGVNQLSTRLPCTLSAFMTVIVLFGLGKRIVGTRAAWIGSLLILLSVGFVLAGRYLTMDAALTFCSTSFALSAFLAIRDRKRSWLVCASIACGLGMLAKGPVIGVLCLPPLLTIIWLSGERPWLKRLDWFFLFAPAIAIASPWFIAMSIAFFPDFALYFFWKHHVVRFSDAFNHREPWWYYIPITFLVMYPGSVLLPSLVKFLASGKAANRMLRTREMGFLTLFACWVIGFFSISESKLPTYILPAFPMICLMIGAMLDVTVFSRENDTGNTAAKNARSIEIGRYMKTTPRRIAWSLCSLAAIGMSVVTFLFTDRLEFSIMEIAFVGAVLMTLMLFACTSRRSSVEWGAAAAIAVCFMVLMTSHLLPTVARVRSIHAAASTVQLEQGIYDNPVVFFCHEDYGSSLWSPLENQISFGADDCEELIMYLERHPKTVLVSIDEPIDELNRQLVSRGRVSKVKDRRHVYMLEQPVERVAEMDSRELR